MEKNKRKGIALGDTWFVSLKHFLDDEGAIAVPKGPARKLAEHIVAIVAMASRPELIPLSEYQVRCRRRPGRKPCIGIIEADAPGLGGATGDESGTECGIILAVPTN